MASGSIVYSHKIGPHKIGSYRIEHQGFAGASSCAGAMPTLQSGARCCAVMWGG